MRIAKNAITASIILFFFSFAAFAQSLSHFDAGMEAFNKNKYSEAVKEFKLAVDEDPDSIGSRFYYALALYYTDKLDVARDEFRKIAEKAKDSPWGKSAMSYIEAIDLGIYAPAPENDFGGYLNLSYDSNDNMTYNPVLVAEGGDNRTYGQISLVYKPTILSSKPFSISCNTFGSMYYKNTDYNEYGGGTDASLYLPFFLGSFLTFSGGGLSDYLKYDPYYTSSYDELRLTFNVFGESLAWTSLYGGSSNTFYMSSTYEVFDSYDSKIGIRQNLNALMYVEYLNKLSDTRGGDFAYRSDEYSIGAVAPFPGYHKLTFTVKYMNKFFLYEDSIGKEHRHDTSYTFDMLISRNLIKNLSFGLRYSITAYLSNLLKDESALGYGSYLDHILSLSFSYKF
jgi:tetratricopeptide (TPR) repeat protein